MAIDFNKFDKNCNLEGLKKDIKDAEQNKREYKEVPHGTYEVKVVKLELGETKENPRPMVKGQFKVLEGEYKGSSIFMNQVITEGFQIDIVNKFLRSLAVFNDSDIYFETYKDYNDLLLDITEEIEKQGLEYLLIYSNNKGFSKFEIEEVYTKEE